MLTAGVTALAVLLLSKSESSGGSAAVGSYAADLNKTPAKLRNIGILLRTMINRGIYNKFVQAAILAIISKESEFIPQRENMNYTAQRIMDVFGLSAAEASQYAHNPEALANRVYGGKGGNAANEGYKYRGIGFVDFPADESIDYNQITFKRTYDRLGKDLGYDFVSNPELLLDPVIAAAAAVQYFYNAIASGKALGKLAQYNSTGINDFSNLTDAVNAIYNANAGWGISKAAILADRTGGRKKVMDRKEDLYNLVKMAA